MNVRMASDSDKQSWDAYVWAHPEGLAYHRFAWKTAVAEAYGFEGIYLMAERNGNICGVFPLIDFKVPFGGRSLVSLPYCDVGGPLTDNPETTRLLLQSAREWCGTHGCGKLTVRYGKGPVQDVETQRFSKVRMVLELPATADILLEGFKAKLRSQVKKPVRDGLTAKLGGAELVNEFYRIFCPNMRSLGSPVHSKRWIAAVVEAFGPHARVGVVYSPEGTPAAAGILLLHNRTVSVPWASSRREMNRLNANALLYWTFLSHAAQEGFTRFDFGRSTPGEGTYKFKEQWGAHPEPLLWVEYGRDEETLIEGGHPSAARKLIESCWRRMPLEVCNTLGPLVRRHISL